MKAEELQQKVISVIDDNINIMIAESKRKDKDKVYRNGCEASVSVLVATKIKIEMMFKTSQTNI